MPAHTTVSGCGRAPSEWTGLGSDVECRHHALPPTIPACTTHCSNNCSLVMWHNATGTVQASFKHLTSSGANPGASSYGTLTLPPSVSFIDWRTWDVGVALGACRPPRGCRPPPLLSSARAPIPMAHYYAGIAARLRSCAVWSVRISIGAGQRLAIGFNTQGDALMLEAGVAGSDWLRDTSGSVIGGFISVLLNVFVDVESFGTLALGHLAVFRGGSVISGVWDSDVVMPLLGNAGMVDSAFVPFGDNAVVMDATVAGGVRRIGCRDMDARSVAHLAARQRAQMPELRQKTRSTAPCAFAGTFWPPRLPTGTAFTATTWLGRRSCGWRGWWLGVRRLRHWACIPRSRTGEWQAWLSLVGCGARPPPLAL